MRFFSILVLLFFMNFGLLQAQVAKRVVSLAQSITKNIYLLQAQDKLVGCTSYCQTNKEDNIAVIGSAVKVNIEKIYSLKPDLVITTGLTSPETLGMLSKLGIKYKVFESPKNFNDICSQFAEIGKLIGKNEKARNIIQKEKAKLEALKKQIPKGKKPKIFIELGTKPLFAVIPNTFMHDYIAFVGGENIATNVTTGIISRETVLLRNPDVIFVTTMGNIGAQEVDIWKSYKVLNAIKNNQIFLIDSNMACTPTPDSFTNTVEKMIEMMYK